MTEQHITSYPLCWPDGWQRNNTKEISRFGKYNNRVSIAKATDFVIGELNRMGIGDFNIIISSNLKLRNDGLPYSSQRNPDDIGISVWWKDDGKQRVIALDQYDRIADNLYAIGKTIEAMRGIERWGGGEILERTFSGFAALPDLSKRNWRQVLNVPESSDPNHIKACYKIAANYSHPDKDTGDNDKFIEVKQAYEQAKQELGF